MWQGFVFNLLRALWGNPDATASSFEFDQSIVIQGR
jgi:hypothetical protein